MKLIVLLKSTNFVQLIQKMTSWTTFQILNSFSHSILDLRRPYSTHLELCSQDSSSSRRAPVPRLIFQHLAPQTSRPKIGITNVWGDIGLQEQEHKQRRRCELQMLKQDGKPEFLLWQRDKIPSWEGEILNLALSLWPEWPRFSLCRDCEMKRLEKIPGFLIWAPQSAHADLNTETMGRNWEASGKPLVLLPNNFALICLKCLCF